MKTTFFLLAAGLLALGASAQDRWTVQLNSKLLLSAKTEDTTANTVSLKDLKKGSLIVTYVPGTVENQRKRKLMVYDAADQELYSREALSITVPVATLKKWKRTSPQVTVYTLPVLGESGANVRLRRVHLCTIHFD